MRSGAPTFSYSIFHPKIDDNGAIATVFQDVDTALHGSSTLSSNLTCRSGQSGSTTLLPRCGGTTGILRFASPATGKNMGIPRMRMQFSRTLKLLLWSLWLKMFPSGECGGASCRTKSSLGPHREHLGQEVAGPVTDALKSGEM